MLRRLIKDRQGGVAVYTGALLAFAVAAGTVAVDLGRLTLLRGQMQDHADAAALAGAVHLDLRAGARDRAERVAREAAWTTPSVGARDAFGVTSIEFFSNLETRSIAETDGDAIAIRVALEPRDVALFFQPMLNFIAGAEAESIQSIRASAIATPSPFVCHAPPLMMCDPSEVDSAVDLRDPAFAGTMVRLKPPQGTGNSPLAPGNFGVLSLPDGSTGASAIEAAMAAVEPQDCYDLDVTTAPGSRTQPVRRGMNARFDLPDGYPHPAPNVINYPRDTVMIADENRTVGDGNWDLAGYWSDKHGGSVPSELSGASRYQVYLYELGRSFARNGKRTIYPVQNNEIPSGYTIVTPPGEAIPTTNDPDLVHDRDHDGVPYRAVASNDHARRLVAVPLLHCQADQVRGRGTYPTGGRYVEVFITQEVPEPPNAAIYGEVVRPLTPSNAPDYHANVRLVE